MPTHAPRLWVLQIMNRMNRQSSATGGRGTMIPVVTAPPSMTAPVLMIAPIGPSPPVVDASSSPVTTVTTAELVPSLCLRQPSPTPRSVLGVSRPPSLRQVYGRRSRSAAGHRAAAVFYFCAARKNAVILGLLVLQWRRNGG